MNFYRLIQGDCLKVLPTLEENSVDCIVTDPPYGLNFMGKNWDKALPSKKIFKEMFRVLKPGALAFVMSSPRQDVLWRMMSMLEGVGFELKQSPIYWTYACGFPKAYDVSKGIDKKILQIKFFDEIRVYLRFWLNESSFSIREINEKMGYAITGSGMAGHWFANITQQTLPTKEQWFKLKDLLKFDDNLDEIYKSLRNGAERPQIGKDSNWSKNGVLPWHGQKWNITKPKTDLAKKWNGWKSQMGLKPAVEVALMVNKPRSEKTIVDNVLKHSVGAMNVDECRIPFKNKEDLTLIQNKANKSVETSKDKYGGGYKQKLGEFGNINGRFPANLLVSDNVLNGEFSRFFSLDAWWRSRVKKLPLDVQKTFPFLCVPKASKSERNKGLEQLKEKLPENYNTREVSTTLKLGQSFVGYDGSTHTRRNIPQKMKNFHPTVKPLKLMTYLITLGCPPNGTVLDPFLGSGTTMLASVLMNNNCIGIELNSEYCKIAKARCFKTTLNNTYSFEII